MELVVAMSISAVSLVIIAASFVAMYRTSSKAESISDTSTQVGLAFNRLDTWIRYAAAISKPGVGSDGNWYVEWSGAVPSSADCSQLRINVGSHQLQQRTWDLNDTSDVVDLSGWQTLAGELQPAATSTSGSPSPEPPFSLGADTAVPYQQLAVHLIATNAERLAGSTAAFDITFTALNSQPSTDPQSICQQVGRS